MNPLGMRFAHLNKWITVQVINAMDPENKVPGSVQTTFFHTFGYLRKQIADAFGLDLNQFILSVKQRIVDPDEDDDRYAKESPALLQKAVIRRNPDYDPAMHPKFLIAENQDYFNAIFQMLQGSSPELCESVWSLINKLPQS